MNTKSVIEEASTALSEGARALAEDAFVEAIMAFRAGIRVVADHYRRSGSIDSTSTREMLAGVEEGRGNVNIAAHLLHRVLETRLALYCKKCADESNVLGDKALNHEK